MSDRRTKPLLLWAGVLLLVAVSLELTSMLAFRVFRDRFTFFGPELYVAREGSLERTAERFDAELGWDNRYPTRFGERPRARDFGRPLVATWGDSFTHGDQVADDETWQTRMAQRLRGDVFNFGVGAYGTDQALLKFQREYPRVRTPVAVLGLITENINRVVNVYRPFYFERTGIRMTKPRMRLAGGELVVIPNPIQSVAGLEKLRSPAFLAALGEQDFWYGRHGYPELRFPYTSILLNGRIWREAFYGLGSAGVDDLAPRPWEELWAEPAPRELMFALFDRFAREAEAAGAVPVIAILPDGRELHELLKRRSVPRDVRRVLDYCQRAGRICFDGVTALGRGVETKAEASALVEVHPNAEGNRRIGDAFADFLVERLPAEVLR